MWNPLGALSSFFRRGCAIADSDEILDARAALEIIQRQIEAHYVELRNQQVLIQQHRQLVTALEEELQILRLSLEQDHPPLVASRMIH